MNRCICGAAVINLSKDSGLPDTDSRNIWVHVPGSDTRCTEVRRIEDVELDRDLAKATTKQMADLVTYAKLGRGEIEQFQSIVGELMEDVARLHAKMTDPELIRRAALTEVWNVLIEAENLAGARIVRDMIKAVK